MIGIGKFALVRRPLLQLSTFDRWRSSLDAERFVIDSFNAPLLEEGLYIANPALHARLLQIRSGDPSLHANERRNAIVSLTKFLSRAAFRCTPFGLFAHVQFARIGSAARTATALRRGLHLDAGVEAALVEAALKDHDWRRTLAWQISSTAHIVGKQLSYVDWIYQDDGQRKYRAVELEMNEGLALLHQRCQSPQGFGPLCEVLVTQLDASVDDATEFLHALIERRLLLPALAATASAACSLDALLAAGPPHPATAPLRAVQTQLHALRAVAASTRSLVPDYQALQALVDTQLPASQRRHGALQIDSIDDGEVTLDAGTAQRIAHAAQLLARHTARRRPALDDYKRLFRARFDDREVSLAYAMHAELGIAFPVKGGLASPLLDGLKLAAPAQAGADAPVLNAFDKLLIERLFAAAASGQGCIAIDEADLARLPVPAAPPQLFAEGLYAHATILPAAPGVPAAIHLHALDGRNGLEMMARFCHLSDALAAAATAYHAEAITHSDAIYAEIIHHPQDRLLNILRRPRLGTHDIVFAGASERPRARQLWLDDLTVQLVGERFVLRERSSGRPVVARLTSAHNYTSSQLGAYQFLCYLQDDDAAWVGFHWPHAVRDLPRLPRVEVAGVIVARAQWVLRKDDIDALNAALVDGSLEAWRAARQLPHFITCDHGDNRLPIDLCNRASALMLLDEIIKLPSATVQECLPLNHAAGDGHNQEWVLPLTVPQRPSGAGEGGTMVQHEGTVHAVMAEWTYLRVYSGSGHADRVLRETIMPVMQAAMQAGEIDRWFFVRYQDDFEHLRIRFHSEAPVHATLRELHRALETARRDGLLWRVVGDHYVPETARYGGERSLALCERLFCLDAEEMQVLLALEAGMEDDAPPRWLFALASLDAYVHLLCPAPDARERLLDSLASAFLDEQAPGPARPQALVALGARFRDKRKDLAMLNATGGPLAAWRQHLQSAAPRRAALIAALRAELGPHAASAHERVWQSLVHMHCNRLVPSEPRRHEVLLYDFARRIERTRQARCRAAALEALA